MSAVTGLVAGVVGLSLLELVVTNNSANGRVGDVITLASDALTYWLDPTIPLIPVLPGGSAGPNPGTDKRILGVPIPGSAPNSHGSGDPGHPNTQKPPGLGTIFGFSDLRHPVGPGSTTTRNT